MGVDWGNPTQPCDVSGGTVCYTYNALGQRVEKKVGSVYTEYVYGAYGELFNLHDRTTWTAHYIPMGATPLAVYQDGTTRFFHANGLGSTTFLTDHAGATTQKSLFYPWGQRWTVAGTLKDERFASLGQRDAETTTWQDPLDPTLFRLYTSGLGRWLSPDPLGGDITNPQSLNRYAYALNSPCSYTDPLGLDTCKLNFQFINDAGLTNAQVTAAEQQINQFLGSVPSTNGDTVGINWVTSGQTDATLTATNQSWFGEHYPYTSGAMGAESSVLSPRVYVNNLPDAWTGSLVGAVGLHELGHYFGFTRLIGRDLAYDASNPNTMMFDYMPPQTQTNMLLNPNSSNWELSPHQVGDLFTKCQGKHPPAATGARGPGGGGRGGGFAGNGGGGWTLAIDAAYQGNEFYGFYLTWIWYAGRPIVPRRK